MCDTHIDEIGYVCNDCQREFKEYLSELNLSPRTKTDIHNALETFMETTPRKNYGSEEISIEEFFRNATRA